MTHFRGLNLGKDIDDPVAAVLDVENAYLHMLKRVSVLQARCKNEAQFARIAGRQMGTYYLVFGCLQERMPSIESNQRLAALVEIMDQLWDADRRAGLSKTDVCNILDETHRCYS